METKILKTINSKVTLVKFIDGAWSAVRFVSNAVIDGWDAKDADPRGISIFDFVMIRRQTEKAMLFFLADGREVWLPKSQLTNACGQWWAKNWLILEKELTIVF